MCPAAGPPAGARPGRSGRGRPQPRGSLDLRDPAVARRLAATGVPGDVAARMVALDVGVGLIERLHRVGIRWQFVASLMHTHAVTRADDMAGMLNLFDSGLEEAEVAAWARLGSLDAAVRLYSKNVTVEQAARFPLSGPFGLEALLRMFTRAAATQMRQDDYLLWFTGGALTLTAPYVVEAVWAPWRSAAVHHLGMARAALAAGAGLQPEEAVRIWHEGTFNDAALRMLAAMRIPQP